ncbi:glycosyltransferase family 61 protein [Salinirubrum litoreum]|uniref:Glycosyltransferase family 61 protein n=1 Tax=Salinirubrum litoreum TaxID=1126234 RepID=A0ABD5R951_9EURY|nr:glycosyltransferase family 61 protein [Salinirubrum litoreum]
MLSTVRQSFRQRGLVDGVRWNLWNVFRGKYKPLAEGTVQYAPFLFLDTDELKQHCRRHGECWFYGDAKRYTFDAPDHALPEVRALDGEYVIPQPFVGVAEDARLVGPYPFALLDGKISLDATVTATVTALNLFYTLRDTVEDGPRATLGGGRREFDRAVLLYNCWNSGYYHWVTETLTRLEGVEAYSERTGETPTLVVGPDFGGFQRETLELLGYGPEDWVEWDCAVADVDELVIPSVRRQINRGAISPVAVDWLRERMRPAVRERVDPDQFSERVYISRNDATRRSVSNEDELFAELEARGFERYCLAEMPTAETIALMMQAEIVVGPHGAGLTDILYADDAAVIELCRGEKHSRAYYTLSSQVGLRHRSIPGEIDGADMRADVDAVVEAVETELDQDQLKAA